MKNILFLASFVLLFTSCKKSSSSEPELNLYITANGISSATLPVIVQFAASTTDYDNISWDFGDGTTGNGLSVSHSYSHFGCFTIVATAKKGSKTVTVKKIIPVSIFKRVVMKTLEVQSIPAYAAGGLTWDDGSDPDLTYSIVFPGDTLYDASTVLWNTTTGLFNLPTKGTYDLAGDITFKIFDKDTGDTPDRAPMGFATLNVCQFLNGPTPTTPVDSAIITNGPLTLKIKWVWIPL